MHLQPSYLFQVLDSWVHASPHQSHGLLLTHFCSLHSYIVPRSLMQGTILNQTNNMTKGRTILPSLNYYNIDSLAAHLFLSLFKCFQISCHILTLYQFYHLTIISHSIPEFIQWCSSEFCYNTAVHGTMTNNQNIVSFIYLWHNYIVYKLPRTGRRAGL